MTVPAQQMIPAWVDGQLVPVEKLAAHRQGYLHKAVSVFVLQGDCVLIQRRAMCKYHTPGLWANTCCTHPLWEESALDCAHRRLNEELGLTGLELQYRDQVTYRADVGNDLIEHERVDIFVSRVDHALIARPNPSEVMDTEWVDLAELRHRIAQTPERFTPWLRIYLDQHAGQIFQD